jgi:hypothetical protein
MRAEELTKPIIITDYPHNNADPHLSFWCSSVLYCTVKMSRRALRWMILATESKLGLSRISTDGPTSNHAADTLSTFPALSSSQILGYGESSRELVTHVTVIDFDFELQTTINSQIGINYIQ